MTSAAWTASASGSWKRPSARPDPIPSTAITKAAQAVLKSLLPETNSDIKGRMRSSHELRLASGYNDRRQ